MRTMFRTVLGLSLVALVASPAFAQGGRGFGMGGGGGYAMLIGNSGVQKELKLDDQQIEKAKELAAKAREDMQGVREKLQGLEGEEQRTKRAELMKEMNDSAIKAVGAFLKPEQIARLKQVSYHTLGARALSDPEVAKKLNITDSQKTDIQTIVQESMEGMRGLFSQDQSEEDRATAMKKMAELRKEALDKASAKLNDEQQKTWKELLGAPFEFKPDPRPAQ
jgi:hypothetical protein